MTNTIVIPAALIRARISGALSNPICPDHGNRPCGNIRERAGGSPPVSSITRTSCPDASADTYAAIAAGCATVAESPTRRTLGAHIPKRARHNASWSPRLVPASACTSSTTTHANPANIAAASARESNTARLSGVVSKIFGGFSRCRTRRLAGVSPVRVSIVTASDISSTGAIKFRAISTANAFRGEIYKVCNPSLGRSCNAIKLGRNPAKVLPPPVGAISSALSPARAAASMAS